MTTTKPGDVDWITDETKVAIRAGFVRLGVSELPAQMEIIYSATGHRPPPAKPSRWDFRDSWLTETEGHLVLGALAELERLQSTEAPAPDPDAIPAWLARHAFKNRVRW